MKKQELIHLHGLLAEVSNHYEQNAGTPDFEAYESLGVRPTSIHKSKTDHKAAVFAIATGITSDITEETQETVAAQAD
ncbi:hypothetical protein HAPAU_20260 [Halalkalicoccus paucihalophilus]|uniref:Metal-binding protein n=1 Tax=Halalkalicoccus paucihalophilus TaxID=1008153 RepID=A0A151ACC9_9EURY|nr:UPF0058 family protein [Halalkalicoccus paucihalophilus]KYH25356.1 hypothetical protein HAPAU_20260 [Halalkalicoccus paucihalophilus]